MAGRGTAGPEVITGTEIGADPDIITGTEIGADPDIITGTEIGADPDPDIIDPVACTPYVRAFEREVRACGWRPLPTRGARAALRSADIVLLGEYHPLPSAAGTAGEVLAEWRRVGLPCALGLEMVHARDQRALDDFLARRCGASELRRRIRWREEWGYAWVPSLALLRAARAARVTVRGLDLPPRGGADALRLRDKTAAARVGDLLRCAAPPRVAIVFGEAHLALGHLPRALLRASPRPVHMVRVYHDLEDGPLRPGWYSAGPDTLLRQALAPPARSRALAATWRRWAKDTPAPDEIDLTQYVHTLAAAQAEAVGRDLRRTRTGPARWLADELPEVALDNACTAFDPLANRVVLGTGAAPLALQTAQWLVWTLTGIAAPDHPLALALALLVDPALEDDLVLSGEARALTAALRAGEIPRALLRRRR